MQAACALEAGAVGYLRKGSPRAELVQAIRAVYAGKRWIPSEIAVGRGTEPAILRDGAAEGHWGLVGVRERATRMDGKLAVSSKPGLGTELEVRIPERTAYLDRKGPLAIVVHFFEGLRRLLISRPDMDTDEVSSDSRSETSVSVQH